MESTLNRVQEVGDWVRLYSDRLYTWAYLKTANRLLAEDLVQDTFTVAYQTYDQFERKSQPMTWLSGILKRKIAEHYRLKSRENIISFSLFFDENGDWKTEQLPQDWTKEETDSLLDDIAFRDMLYQCLYKLPEPWLNCITAKYLEGKESNQICLELNIKAANFWQIMHRAKLQLRKCIEINGFTP
ncbi:MAG: sigma-70 family RNA polymerase sigma factor [Bacteroidia bacterium]|nr:sigma-70 family RNA polymerase sigma factor [Bacteroidia bacterium]